ncbi:MAG: hypothetical protein AAB922_04345 [Patescibacteria group bacterium]
MTKTSLADRFADTNAWKDSADPVERTAYYISYLSPHNLWKAKEALQQLLIEAEARGAEKERERMKQIMQRKYCGELMEEDVDPPQKENHI